MPVRSNVIGIVGGGASGVLTSVHLLHSAPDPVRVVVFEPRESLGRGVAYSTPDPRHLLNVPAGRLSAFSDNPGHFSAWAAKRTPSDERSFLPRGLYGDYLSGLLHPVEHIRDRVIDITLTDSGAVVGLADGSSMDVDRLVLALGSTPPSWPAALAPLAVDTRLISDPWAADALVGVPGDAPVLLVGTGLTAVDTALSLHAAGHRQIVAISRRGLLPGAHHPDPPARLAVGSIGGPAAESARGLFR